MLFFASLQRGNKRGNLKIDQGLLGGQLPSNLAARLVRPQGLARVARAPPGAPASPSHPEERPAGTLNLDGQGGDTRRCQKEPRVSSQVSRSPLSGQASDCAQRLLNDTP